MTCPTLLKLRATACISCLCLHQIDMELETCLLLHKLYQGEHEIFKLETTRQGND